MAWMYGPLVLISGLISCVLTHEEKCYTKFEYEFGVLHKLAHHEEKLLGQDEKFVMQNEKISNVDKVLHKMAELELVFASLRAKVSLRDRTIDSLDERVKDQNDEIAALRALMLEQSDEITVLQALTSQQKDEIHALQNLTSRIKEENVFLKAELEQMNDTITELESDPKAQGSMTPTVAFKSRSSSHVSFSLGQTIVFPVVMFNNGSAYDPGTGVFTAPINGTYLFTMQACPKDNYYFCSKMIVDGVVHNAVVFYGQDGTPCFTADTAAVLTVNQNVSLKSSCGSSATIYHDSVRWSSFAGVLLHL